MSGYLNIDNQKRVISKVFGRVGDRTVEAQSIWANKDGSPVCVFRAGERPIYVVGFNAGNGNKVFPMAYTYDLNTFIQCSIELPAGYSSYSPTAIKNLFYAEKLGLYIALAYSLDSASSSSKLRWYMLYSEDGKSWSVSNNGVYDYYSTNIFMSYEPESGIILVANRGPSGSSSSSAFNFYLSKNGRSWKTLSSISPLNSGGSYSFNASDVEDMLVPGDGYIYLSNIAYSSFSSVDGYHAFVRTKDGENYELVGNAMDYATARTIYGSQSLILYNGKYYDLDRAFHVYNPDYSNQYTDYYNGCIRVSEDGMNTWSDIPLIQDSKNKNWVGLGQAGFYMVNGSLYVSIKKGTYESYAFKMSNTGTWSEVSSTDYAKDVLYRYLYFPIEARFLSTIKGTMYRTGKEFVSMTTDGENYVEVPSLSDSLLDLFELSSGSGYLIISKQ